MSEDEMEVTSESPEETVESKEAQIKIYLARQ